MSTLLIALLQLQGLWLLVQTPVLVLAGHRLPRTSRAVALLYILLNAGMLWVGSQWLGLDQRQAIVGVMFCGAVFTVGLVRLRDWNLLARLYFPVLCSASLLYLVYVAILPFSAGFGLVTRSVTAVLFLLQCGSLALTVTAAYDVLDVVCRIRWRRRFPPADGRGVDGYLPFVSFHVPAYSEPPLMLKETLNALAGMDYPNFEVLVIDNNTKDPDLWEPVAAYCRELGPRFRFFHLDPWPGFKAGACNFAIGETNPAAEIIAIVDADYVVEPQFLRETVSYFRDPEVAFLQTPQDYRGWEGRRFLTDCYHAYKYFFEISMVGRNESNAIIFCGTMGLIRKRVLEEIGGWDEQSITEDAEASLRILQRGYRSIYVKQTYGRGLMPFEFDSYKKQRFRWCFGGIQILRKHWRALAPFVARAPDDRMTAAQRYHYLASGLQWFNEVLSLAFTIFLLVSGIVYALGGRLIAQPLLVPILLSPLLFLASGLLRFGWTLRIVLRVSLRDAIGAMISFFSLSWIVAFACLQGLIHSRGTFLRTSKVKGNSDLVRSLVSTRWETGLALVCLVTAVLTLRPPVTIFGLLASFFASWGMIVYGSAAYACLAALRGEAEAERLGAYRRRLDFGPPTTSLATRSTLAGALALGMFVSLVGVLYAPGVDRDLAAVQTATERPLLSRAAVGRPVPNPLDLGASAPRSPLVIGGAIPGEADSPAFVPAFLRKQPQTTPGSRLLATDTPILSTPTLSSSPSVRATSFPSVATPASAPTSTPAPARQPTGEPHPASTSTSVAPPAPTTLPIETPPPGPSTVIPTSTPVGPGVTPTPPVPTSVPTETPAPPAATPTTPAPSQVPTPPVPTVVPTRPANTPVPSTRTPGPPTFAPTAAATPPPHPTPR